MPRRPPYTAPAVEGALSILETLSTGHEMGVSDLAKKLGLGKSSVYRLLATLVRRGYVQKSPQTDRYQLTYRLFAVGSPAADRFGLREVATLVMQRLAAETGETVNLGVLDGARVVNLHKVESRHPLRLYLQLEGGAPAHATALGKVLLAALEPEEVARRLQGRRLDRLTSRTIGDRRSLWRALAKVGEQGFAIDDEECSLGLRCVAAPILDHRRAVVAAVSISGPSQRLPVPVLSRLAENVQVAAREISERLGFPANPRREKVGRGRVDPRHPSREGSGRRGVTATNVRVTK
jgi:IclR family KDG regulon transcriptional repressor